MRAAKTGNCADANSRFGSAHSAGAGFIFCDGSVHLISFDIDTVTHSRLASRADGQSVDSEYIR